jgi:hypothetical protein
MTRTNEYPRSALAWLSSLVAALLFAIGVGAPTGFSLLVLFQSRSLVGWLLVFPLVLGIVVLLTLHRWQTTRRRRLSSFVGSAIVLFVIDGLIVFGGLRPRSPCTWEYSDEVAATTDLSAGLPLAADDKGTYSDAVDGVDTFIKHSLKLAMYEPQPFRPTTTARHLLVDLSRPVPGSGAVPLGVRSTGREFKVYWYQDSNGMVRTVHAIPLGATVASDRADILLDIDGRAHRLTMGRWRTPYCDAEKGIGGSGTTEVTIRRLGQEEYTADTPIGGIARLWDVSGRAPKDRGLYYFGFHAHFVRK